jgi:Do/DeqQ family serine protease
MRTYLFAVLLALIIVSAGVVFVAARRNSPTNRGAAHETAPPPVATTGDAGSRGDVVTTGLFRAIAKRENPVVVAITTESRVKTADLQQTFGNNDFFRQFFGFSNVPREQVQEALGSGFLISSTGEIITNNHVVAGADRIRVGLFSNEHRTYPAEVVGRDPLTDSALIKLKDGPPDLPIADLGDSDALEPGDWVMAIGNPFQLGHTVTVGVISFKGRPFATTEGRFQNMIQTDASINPGNSGGPLLDVHGDVIGVNSAILSGDGSGGNIGIGFAVPINTVKNLLPQLRKGVVQRGQLGVQILSAPLTEDEAKNLGLPNSEGAIVSRVEPDSPADRAGLRAGDVITDYNNKAIQDADHLTAMVVNTPPETQVPIVFYRNGQRQTATVTIEKLDLEGTDQSAKEAGSASGFGLSLGDITPDVADQLRLPADLRGAVVENVEAFTPASNAGLKPGDIVVAVNRHPIRSAREASRELRAIKSGEPAFLLLWRQGVQQFVELRRE